VRVDHITNKKGFYQVEETCISHMPGDVSLKQFKHILLPALLYFFSRKGGQLRSIFHHKENTREYAYILLTRIIEIYNADNESKIFRYLEELRWYSNQLANKSSESSFFSGGAHTPGLLDEVLSQCGVPYARLDLYPIVPSTEKSSGANEMKGKTKKLRKPKSTSDQIQGGGSLSTSIDRDDQAIGNDNRVPEQDIKVDDIFKNDDWQNILKSYSEKFQFDSFRKMCKKCFKVNLSLYKKDTQGYSLLAIEQILKSKRLSFRGHDPKAKSIALDLFDIRYGGKWQGRFFSELSHKPELNNLKRHLIPFLLYFLSRKGSQVGSPFHLRSTTIEKASVIMAQIMEIVKAQNMDQIQACLIELRSSSHELAQHAPDCGNLFHSTTGTGLMDSVLESLGIAKQHSADDHKVSKAAGKTEQVGEDNTLKEFAPKAEELLKVYAEKLDYKKFNLTCVEIFHEFGGMEKGSILSDFINKVETFFSEKKIKFKHKYKTVSEISNEEYWNFGRLNPKCIK